MGLNPSNSHDRATANGLRLEGRLDARLQEVTARLVLHDGRFAALGDRVNQTDRRADAASARLDAWMGAADARFDALDTRHDRLDVRLAELRTYAEELASQYRAATIRATVIGVAVTVAVDAALVGAAAWAVAVR